jgi:hypothetical protein
MHSSLVSLLLQRTSIAVSSLAWAASLQAATFTTNVVQGAADTNHWNAPIWNPGGVSPTAGNVYEVLSGARVRSPNGTVASGGTAVDGQTFTFPGTTLTLDGPTGELRIKQNFNNPVFNFPGAGGSPGLLFNGGILNDGDDRIMTIAGAIGASAGTTSSINPGGSAVTDISALRGFIFTASLSGDGAFALNFGHDTTTAGATVPALRIDSSNPGFTGDWVLNSGWVLGAGVNALGSGDMTLTSTQGPSTIDYDYNAFNPTSVLTLNGTTSKLVLDQNLTFGGVTINGTALTPGLHTFAELNSAFNANIVDGGNGTITVVPEPSALTASLLGLVTMLGFRRRGVASSTVAV